jgi:hypothetical protein
VGSANVKYADSVTSHLKELSLNQSIGGPTSSVSSTPTNLVDVHSMQSSSNLNGKQQPGPSSNHSSNHRGGKNNNKPKENGNNEKSNNNVGEGKKETWKVKFPCKLCIDDHLTYLCLKLAEAARILSLPPTMLSNPFPHNKHMALSSSNAKNVVSGSQNPLTQDGDNLCIHMVKSEVNVATWSRDYSSPQIVPGLESPPPPEMPLQIKKPEPPHHIPKGVFKGSTHNPNARATHNYSIVEDLGQTPCTMSTLEVLQMCS